MAEEYKVGDVLLIASYNGKFLDEVEHVTKGGKAKTSKGFTFAPDGGQVGGGAAWHHLSARKATPEDIEAVKEAKRKSHICEWLRLTHLRSLPLETLEQIYRLAGGE